MGSQAWWEGLAKVKWPDVPPSVIARGTWYQQSMHSARWRARLLDLTILVLAAGVPFAVAIKAGNWVVALLGSLIETEVVRYKQALDEYSDEAAGPRISCRTCGEHRRSRDRHLGSAPPPACRPEHEQRQRQWVSV
ncbi:hypothetical protein JCM4814A_09310 [Streptomyces phaeofaciens JCM 4814]|uniref:Uncharacterized protein n=1 Tax=Streptomyces phaeofaciens TaxID=68254 RepID=A0A918HTJ4_9ACTN|nr:hypothetical protein GCM10010226_91640 [Streptomyces phaeofaciens]